MFSGWSRETKLLVGGGALAVALLAAGYYLTRDSSGKVKTVASPKTYFMEDFEDEAGSSKELSKLLGGAFKGSVEYDIKLWVQHNEKRFKGITEILFEPSEELKDHIYISTNELEVYQIRVNDHKVDQNYFNEMTQTQAGAIFIDNKRLTKEKIKLEIRYRGNFGDTYGLLFFNDPASPSGDSYVFSSTNILGASSIYPCFESLEVRSMFRLTLAVSRNWRAYSNEKSDDPVDMDDTFDKFGNDVFDPNKEDYHMFKFRQTKSIAFNALNITAGNFSEIKTKTTILGRKVNVYTLNSQSTRYKDIAETCGKVVKSAIYKMEKLTGVKYPYSKCDVMVLPDQLIFPSIFSINPIKVSKEYPGLITVFQRDYRNFKAEFVYELLTSLIKLWFGVLVSVDWWGGAWLCESFSRYIAMRTLREDHADYELSSNDINYLNLWLKTQAIYHEMLSDLTLTNVSLTSAPVGHAFEAIFLMQAQAEKVGPYRFEELFSYYPEDTLENLCKSIASQYNWKHLDIKYFNEAFTFAVQDAPETEDRLRVCFEYPRLDKIKISRTSEDKVTVQRIASGTETMSKSHPVEIVFVSKTGSVIKRETAILTSFPIVFDVNKEVYTFLSVMKTNGLFYEVYERDELERLFEVVRNNKTLEPEFRLKAVRILFSNTFKSKSLSLSDSLTYLKSLLECCLPEEQKWIVRSFSVVGKHIERNDSTELAIRDFCEFLVTKATTNDGLVPYLGYFGVFDIHCKKLVSDFVRDFNNTAHHIDSQKATLNYDLLKSCILFISYSRLDIDTASLYCHLVGKYDPALGSILLRMMESHAEDVLVEHAKITHGLKEMFGTKPSFNNALEYYFKALMIRTENTPEMQEVRAALEKARADPATHSIGGTNNLIYYNIDKILNSFKRDSHDPKNDVTLADSTVSHSSQDMISRRFGHHFRLS
jgi:hypothetical protein